MAKESFGQKLEAVFTKIGEVVQGTENAAVNIEVANQALLTQYLPPAISVPLNAAFSLAANTFAAMVKAEQTAGGSTMPYAEKVAFIVALQAQEIAKLLLAAGVATGQDTISTVVAAATAVGNLNLGTVTQTPAA